MMKKPSLSAFQSFISQFRPRKLFGTKRSRRTRRTVYIACGGAAIIIALILIFTRPPETAAMQPEQSGQTLDIPSSEKTVQIDGQHVVQGSAGAQPTINAFITPTPVNTYLAAALPSPTPEGEVLDAALPTPTPTPTPSATPAPSATPKPSPTPQAVDMDKILKYYLVEADLYYNEVGYSSNYYEYTEDDVYMLAQLIYGEARGESTKGKIAVGNVVMNRVLSRGYPGETIKQVVTASGQFSGYSSSIRPNSSCKSAARQVLERQVWVIPQNVYFFNSNRTPGQDWGGHDYYGQIGNHCFYTESYSGRSRTDSIPPALFERTYKWPQYGCKVERRVKRIQYMLNKLGYDVTADGYFGMDCKEALMEFQKDHGLHADGVAGPTTIEKLIRTFGIDKYADKYL